MTTAAAEVLGAPPSASAEGPVAGPSNRPDDGIHRCTFDGCNKGYTKASKLAQHVRSHTGERPFVCDHPGCAASYMRNEHLKAHQRRHQDPCEKTFACEEQGCELKFWTASQLKNHVQACHADDGSIVTAASTQNYPCTEPGCDMAFHKRKQLRLHIRDHHGLSSHEVMGDTEDHTEAHVSAVGLPFACQYPCCDKRFSTNSKRKKHYRTHQSGRYTCSMDHAQPQEAGDPSQGPHIYTFSTWSALQAHMKEAHPPVCPWPACGKQFQRQDNLRAHYRRHENRKLRLELEAKLIEGSHEHDLNHRRADLSDDSHESEEEREAEASPVRQPLAASTPPTSTPPSWTEEQLVHKAAQLRATRPRRGGLFRDLSSPALSIVSSVSGKTGSALPGGAATSISRTRDASTAFACTWNGCSKIFTRKSTLSIHVRTAHMGERPFECPDCGKRFAHKHLVSRHRRICKGTPRTSPEQVASASGGGGRLRFSSSNTHSDEATGEEEGSDTSDPCEVSNDEDASPSLSGLGSEEEPKCNRLKAADAVAPASPLLKPRLLDLLTGRGYSTALSDTNKRPASEDAWSLAKKRRTTRDRIFVCPWTSIRRELDEQMLDPSLRSSGDGRGDTDCGHRFKRLYDLRRHLKSQHGLDLISDELTAITNRTSWTHVQ